MTRLRKSLTDAGFILTMSLSACRETTASTGAAELRASSAESLREPLVYCLINYRDPDEKIDPKETENLPSKISSPPTCDEKIYQSFLEKLNVKGTRSKNEAGSVAGEIAPPKGIYGYGYLPFFDREVFMRFVPNGRGNVQRSATHYLDPDTGLWNRIVPLL